jgi:hypothetical protein
MAARRFDDLTPIWSEMYLGGMSTHEIAEQFGVRFQSVWHKLRQAGIATRSRADGARRYALRQDAFSDVTDPVACYWLGRLLSDGYIYKHDGTYSLSLTTAERDVESLYGLADFLGTDKPIQWMPKKGAAVLVVTSKKIGEDISLLGMHQAKTLTVRFPTEIPQHNYRHCIRGYFDGDGSIWCRGRPRYKTKQFTASFASNEHMIADITKIISDQCGILPTVTYFQPNKTTMQARYEGRIKLITLREYLYNDGGPSLYRKKSMFFSINGDS